MEEGRMTFFHATHPWTVPDFIIDLVNRVLEDPFPSLRFFPHALLLLENKCGLICVVICKSNHTLARETRINTFDPPTLFV